MDIERYKKIYNEKILKQANQDDSRFIQIKDKETIVRILPSKTGQDFFYQFGYHKIHGERYYCPKFTQNKACPICQFINKLWQSKTDEDIALAREIKLIKRYYFNAVVRGQEDKGVRLLTMGVKFWEKLIMWIANDEIGDFTDPVRGFDIKIVKEDRGDYTSYDNSDLSRKSSLIHPDPKKSAEWLSARYDLIDLVKILSYDELQKVLEGSSVEESTQATPVKSTSAVVVNPEKTTIVKQDIPETVELEVEPEVSVDSIDSEVNTSDANINDDELAKFEAELKKQLEKEK